jgi:hypothetical protein
MREVFFVCSVILDSDLISQALSAKCEQEAKEIFKEKFLIEPKIILGPFYKKRVKKIVTQQSNLEFNNSKFKIAYYNNWVVHAFMLKQPEDHAYLLFIKRLDNKNILPPKGTIIVNINELKFQ